MNDEIRRSSLSPISQFHHNGLRSDGSLTIDDRRDLFWYFNDEVADFGGLRSNFGAMLERIRFRLPPGLLGPEHIEDLLVQRLEHVDGRRLMHRRLTACGTHEARTLRLVFEETEDPTHVAELFGELAALAFDLSNEHAPNRSGPWFENICRRVARGERARPPSDDATVTAVMRIATTNYRAACDAYVEAKRRVR